MEKKQITITRKIKVVPVGDKEEVNRVYQYIRDGQYAQYRALNYLSGELYSLFYSCGMDLKNEEFKEKKKEIFRATNPLLENVEFAVGCDSLSQITQKVQQDFNAAIKNGLAKGQRSVQNYKVSFPLLTRGRDLRFVTDYATDSEMLDNTHDKFDVYIKWINRIQFKIIFGNAYRSRYLRDEVSKIILGEYKVQGSSICVQGKEIILNLSIQMPLKEYEPIANKKAVVALGTRSPLTMTVDNYEHLIGDIDALNYKKERLKNQRQRVMKNLRYSKGGSGRKDKLKALDKCRKNEYNFTRTFNHTLSHRIVDIAVKNNVETIILDNFKVFDKEDFKMEDLISIGRIAELDKLLEDKVLTDEEYEDIINKEIKQNTPVLGNWAYYQLITYVKYKALKHNIKVDVK